MDEVQEQQEIANEISEAISNPVGFDRDFDEVIYFLIFIVIKEKWMKKSLKINKNKGSFNSW